MKLSEAIDLYGDIELNEARKRVMETNTTPIPDFGDLFTMDEFAKHVDCGGIMNYDGVGYYSNGVVVYDDCYVDCNYLDKGYSHVMWFNK